MYTTKKIEKQRGFINLIIHTGCDFNMSTKVNFLTINFFHLHIAIFAIALVSEIDMISYFKFDTRLSAIRYNCRFRIIIRPKFYRIFLCRLNNNLFFFTGRH